MGQTPTTQQGLAALAGRDSDLAQLRRHSAARRRHEGGRYLRSHPGCGIVLRRHALHRAPTGRPSSAARRSGGFRLREFVLACENPIPQPAAFIRRSVVDDGWALDPHYYYFMDWDFFRARGRPPPHRVHARAALDLYRLAPGVEDCGAGGARRARAGGDVPQYFALPDGRPRSGASSRANGEHDFTSGGYYIRRRPRGGAARAALKALRAKAGPHPSRSSTRHDAQVPLLPLRRAPRLPGGANSNRRTASAFARALTVPASRDRGSTPLPISWSSPCATGRSRSPGRRLRPPADAPPDEVVLGGRRLDRPTARSPASWRGRPALSASIEAGEATPGRGRNVGAGRPATPDRLHRRRHHLDPTGSRALARRAEDDPAADIVYGNFGRTRTPSSSAGAALSYVPPRATREGASMPGRARFGARAAGGLAARGRFPPICARREDLIFM